jgi:hypothetical protein
VEIHVGLDVQNLPTPKVAEAYGYLGARDRLDPLLDEPP